MKRKFALIIFIFILLFALVVEARTLEVAYVLKVPRNPNREFLDVFNRGFEGGNYNITLINDDNVRKTDFSKYDILFVADDDNKLKNFQYIPVGDMPSIVANSFHVDDWGLSKEVSLVAANAPLEILILGDGIKEAYTSCCGNNGVGLPMYYLIETYKAQDFTNVAITNIGDLREGVIQNMDTGGELLNGRRADGRICFFGITQTRYWTNDARNLFKGCVDYVRDAIGEIRCDSDNDCDDNDPGTTDRCINPGTPESFCRNENATCVFDSDCGIDGFIDGEFCSNNDVVQTFADYTCLNPGADNAECDTVFTNITREDCGSNICSNGDCVNIICNSDDDCDDNNSHTKDNCVNPGTVDSRCVYENIECLSESDCGVDGFIGVESCSGNNVVKNFVNYTCLNPGSVSSSCTSEQTLKTIESCSDACVEGICLDFTCERDEDCFDQNPNTQDTCINPGTIDSFCFHGNIACNNNLDCGVNMFIGSLYCSNNDILQNFLDYSCVNPGATNSYCALTSEPTKRNECENACINAGICVECNEDSDCDDSNSATVDKCEFPGHFFARCVNLIPICRVSSDCGVDRDTGEFFCVGDDVYVNHLSFGCLEPDTLNSSCTSNIGQRLVQNCQFGCSNGQCLPPVHDVGFDTSLSNSVNGVRLELENGTDILENPAMLISGLKYKVVVDVENNGDFFENVTFDGEVRNIVNTLISEFEHNPKENLAAGDSSLKTKTVNFSLSPGIYNLSVEALINFDEIPENNKVNRIIQVIGGECTSGQTRSCGVTDEGACELGTQTCNIDGTWGFCVGNIDPVTEICFDGLDNDCDGVTDNGCTVTTTTTTSSSSSSSSFTTTTSTSTSSTSTTIVVATTSTSSSSSSTSTSSTSSTSSSSTSSTSSSSTSSTSTSSSTSSTTLVSATTSTSTSSTSSSTTRPVTTTTSSTSTSSSTRPVTTSTSTSSTSSSTTIPICSSCGDTSQCLTGQSCDVYPGICIDLLGEGEADCDCNANCQTGLYCDQDPNGPDYCCPTGSEWNGLTCIGITTTTSTSSTSSSTTRPITTTTSTSSTSSSTTRPVTTTTSSSSTSSTTLAPVVTTSTSTSSTSSSTTRPITTSTSTSSSSSSTTRPITTTTSSSSTSSSTRPPTTTTSTSSTSSSTTRPITTTTSTSSTSSSTTLLRTQCNDGIDNAWLY
ncbi:hypothetical protein HYV88_01440 [Candidatus Woesearchaeota archaeon]|nr:hypothetical protein [Candidatus Woesearchaeota archaeon]